MEKLGVPLFFQNLWVYFGLKKTEAIYFCFELKRYYNNFFLRRKDKLEQLSSI